MMPAVVRRLGGSKRSDPRSGGGSGPSATRNGKPLSGSPNLKVAYLRLSMAVRVEPISHAARLFGFPAAEVGRATVMQPVLTCFDGFGAYRAGDG